MTVQELIDKLNEIEDKKKHIALQVFRSGYNYTEYAIGVHTSIDDDTVYICD